MAILIEIEGRRPKIHETAFIAETAVLAGDVRIGANTGVWHGAVLRADQNTITVGEYCNIQDNAVIHGREELPVSLGHHVTVGHGAVIDDSAIGNYCIIGINSTVMSAKMGNNSILGVGAMVPAGRAVPEKTIFVGLPAKKLRDCTDQDLEYIRNHAEHYFGLLKLHKSHAKRI